MKVPESGVAGAAPAKNAEPAKNKEAPNPTSAGKPFSKVLGEGLPKKKGPEDGSHADQAPMPFLPVSYQPAPADEIASARPALDSSLVQSIVQEVSVATSASGTKQVDVQFNSKTLEGLKVQISREADGVKIKFLTEKPEVTQLLNSHLDQLSQALTAKGIDVAALQVQTPQPSTFHADSSSTSSDKRQGREDQRQDRQQKRQR